MDPSSNKKISDMLAVIIAICISALLIGGTIALLVFLFRQL